MFCFYNLCFMCFALWVAYKGYTMIPGKLLRTMGDILVVAVAVAALLTLLYAFDLPDDASDKVHAQTGTSFIAFSSDRDNAQGEIYVMEADGTNVTRLTNNSYVDYYPDIAPDSSLVVYVSEQNGDADLWGAKLDGSSTWRMTFTEWQDSQPDVSPDSSQLVFMSTRDTQTAGHRQIYKCNLPNCSGTTRLTYTTSDDITPSWSSDGTRIAFTSDRDGNDEIYTMNTSGGDVRRLTYNGAKDVYHDWYGGRILFQSNRSGNWDLYLMDDDGTNVVQLTDNAAIDVDPSFSPDGTHLVFVSSRDGNGELYTMDTAGGDLQRLTNNSALDSHPSWSSVIYAVIPTLTPPPIQTTLPFTDEVVHDGLHVLQEQGRFTTAALAFFGTVGIGLLTLLFLRVRIK